MSAFFIVPIKGDKITTENATYIVESYHNLQKDAQVHVSIADKITGISKGAMLPEGVQFSKIKTFLDSKSVPVHVTHHGNNKPLRVNIDPEEYKLHEYNLPQKHQQIQFIDADGSINSGEVIDIILKKPESITSGMIIKTLAKVDGNDMKMDVRFKNVVKIGGRRVGESMKNYFAEYLGKLEAYKKKDVEKPEIEQKSLLSKISNDVTPEESDSQDSPVKKGDKNEEL
jgi:hypothetical protein